MSGTSTVRNPAPARGDTPRITARIPPELFTAAKDANPELKDADNSLLIRIALAILAGFTVKTALDNLGHQKSGIKIARFPDNTA
jgi:hypothetical protein